MSRLRVLCRSPAKSDLRAQRLPNLQAVCRLRTTACDATYRPRNTWGADLQSRKRRARRWPREMGAWRREGQPRTAIVPRFERNERVVDAYGPRRTAVPGESRVGWRVGACWRLTRDAFWVDAGVRCPSRRCRPEGACCCAHEADPGPNRKRVRLCLYGRR